MTPTIPSRRAFLAGAAAIGSALPAAAQAATASTAGTGMPIGHPDAKLFGWCAAFIELNTVFRRQIDADEENDAFPPGYDATVAAITNTPAKTFEGNRAKLAAAVAFFEPDPPEEGALLTAALWDAACALALCPNAPPVVAVNPDADLIRICAEHILNVQTYDRDGGTGDMDDPDPLWQAYERTRDAIHEARPQTIEGMVAKARAAKVEAMSPEGEEVPEGTNAALWAWELVDDLLRLHGPKLA